MSVFNAVDTLQLAYCPPSREYDHLLGEIMGRKGLDAEAHILELKRKRQTGLIDACIYALVAATGTGKTTTMVYGLLKRMLARRTGKRVLLCTQPRVGLAITQPYNIEQLFPDMKVGRDVGYVTGSGGRIVPTEDKSIIYCTTQILQNYMLTMEPNKFGNHYPLVIIDEAHDSSIEMLTTLQTARRYLRNYHAEVWCPMFIVTSATIDPLVYLRYFGADPDSPYNSALVAGRQIHLITEKYLADEQIKAKEGKAIPLAVEETCAAIVEVLASSKGKSETGDPITINPTHTDILVFWTSVGEIARFFDALKKEVSEAFPNIFLTINTEKKCEETTTRKRRKKGEDSGDECKEKAWKIVYLSITRVDTVNQSANFQTLYEPQQPFEIKVIGATNVLESGANLPNLAYVIDYARQITPVVFPLAKKEAMLSLPISEFVRIQRRGRIGRTGPGTYVGLYDAEAKKQMFRSPPPSTLIGSNVPASVYTIIITKTLAQYKELAGGPQSLGKILSLKRIGYHLPPTDIMKEIQLLAPVSMDSSIQLMSKLTAMGLIEWDGSLTMIGLQVAAYKGLSIVEAFLRIILINKLIHPMDIELLCAAFSESLSRSELSVGLEWKPTISRFYPQATFSFKDKPPVIRDVMEVFKLVLTYFELISGEMRSTLPSVHLESLQQEHKRWETLNTGEIKRAVFDALDNYPVHAAEGAFYETLYVDMPEEGKAVFIEKCEQALIEVDRRIEGRQVEIATEEVPGIIVT